MPVTTRTKGYGLDILLVPLNVGRMTIVKSTIMDIIAGSDSSLSPKTIHVRGDWKTGNQYLATNYPVVTFRLGAENVTERIYGRQISSSKRGHYVAYSFSAHVWSEKSYQLFEEGVDDNQSQAQPASDLADKIIDVFEKYNGDANSGICYFEKITARESEPERGPQRLTRIIIEGFVIVKRPLT
jgi:hypothetical protein